MSDPHPHFCDCEACMHADTVRPLRTVITLRRRDGAARNVELVGFSETGATLYWPRNGHHELDLETGTVRERPEWELDVLQLAELRRACPWYEPDGGPIHPFAVCPPGAAAPGKAR